MENDKEDLISIKLNFDYPSFRDSFPKEWLSFITPSELRKAGFEEIDSEETDSTKRFRKSFSDIITLDIKTSRKKDGKSYCWSINEENFKIMISEIEEIKDYLDKQAKEIYYFSRKSRSNVFEDSFEDYLQSDYMQMVRTATETSNEMKKAFAEKYAGFSEMNNDIQIKTPIYRYQNFFFDACKNTHQLNLCFEFIRLYMDVFGAIRKSKPSVRKISPEKVKAAIPSYYALFFTVKKVRSLYINGLSFEELQTKFPMIREEHLEDFTLESDDKKGWEYKASDIALNFASYTAETTPGNFKQILKQEKKFVSNIRREFSGIENIEEILAGTTIEIEGPDFGLNMERVPEEDFIGLIRWSISHFGKFDED